MTSHLVLIGGCVRILVPKGAEPTRELKSHKGCLCTRHAILLPPVEEEKSDHKVSNGWMIDLVVGLCTDPLSL